MYICFLNLKVLIIYVYSPALLCLQASLSFPCWRGRWRQQRCLEPLLRFSGTRLSRSRAVLRILQSLSCGISSFRLLVTPLDQCLAPWVTASLYTRHPQLVNLGVWPPSFSSSSPAPHPLVQIESLTEVFIAYVIE